MYLFDQALAYFSQHVILGNTAHFAGGFGIAVLLQQYLKGHSFIPAMWGWILLGFSFVVHLMAMWG